MASHYWWAVLKARHIWWESEREEALKSFCYHNSIFFMRHPLLLLHHLVFYLIRKHEAVIFQLSIKSEISNHFRNLVFFADCSADLSEPPNSIEIFSSVGLSIKAFLFFAIHITFFSFSCFPSGFKKLITNGGIIIPTFPIRHEFSIERSRWWHIKHD